MALAGLGRLWVMPASFIVGGIAKAPARPPILRERESTGIGNAHRLIKNPDRRTGMHPELPTSVAPPRPGFPLLATASGSHPLHTWGPVARALLDRHLHRSGAVLLHGLPITSSHDFDTFIAATGYKMMDTMGASDRDRRGANVFTASDDVPPNHTLHPHNEQAYLAHDEQPSYPRKLFFCCLAPASGSGGETPVARNSELTSALARLAPADLQRFAVHGIRYRQRLPGAPPGTGDTITRQKVSQSEKHGQSWQALFQTSDRRMVEKQARTRGYCVSWELPNGSDAAMDDSDWILSLLSPIRPALIDGVFWNQASNVYSFEPCWGDGTPIEDEVLECLNAALWQVSVAFDWSVGDVLCIDNEQTAHGRMSFTGTRRVLVALSKL